MPDDTGDPREDREARMQYLQRVAARLEERFRDNLGELLACKDFTIFNINERVCLASADWVPFKVFQMLAEDDGLHIAGDLYEGSVVRTALLENSAVPVIFKETAFLAEMYNGWHGTGIAFLQASLRDHYLVSKYEKQIRRRMVSIRNKVLK